MSATYTTYEDWADFDQPDPPPDWREAVAFTAFWIGACFVGAAVLAALI